MQSSEINVLCVNGAPIHTYSAPEMVSETFMFALPEAVWGSDPPSLHGGGTPFFPWHSSDHPCALGMLPPTKHRFRQLERTLL